MRLQNTVLTRFGRWLTCLATIFLALQALPTSADSLEPFLGSYIGSAQLDRNGTLEERDMRVTIDRTKKGFSVSWKSTIHTANNQSREKNYTIDFIETRRDNIFQSAMKKDVFGHFVPMNPMKGEPYVWARISGSTLTVFSLHVDEEGSYHMQQYDRTLTEGGLMLDYQSVQNGKPVKMVQAFLQKQ